jgi:hypothetical protein
MREKNVQRACAGHTVRLKPFALEGNQSFFRQLSKKLWPCDIQIAKVPQPFLEDYNEIDSTPRRRTTASTAAPLFALTDETS